MTSRPLPEIIWKKSSRCDLNNCVEVALLPDGSIGLRDSKNIDGGTLTFSPEGWTKFIGPIKGADDQGY
ncbi:DUF397 domain-containing protein [Nonomuraea cavernae]|uniref:DUF397 domain-containing protein n=1 Tax=Nonomuraea cavernae TaxID=2045107 RepID=A0A918DTR6_9ACTN|nr:DUF397 domain-containing protein [Nonomuraea cavernae]MCA2188348.1 DUF397 domain-containing protein [Nonomuraea cavernae]GGO83562.1 hypothetical protein GCM10012289_77280 [Nonomuraea cavernae]